jgi:hypothetical protein
MITVPIGGRRLRSDGLRMGNAAYLVVTQPTVSTDTPSPPLSRAIEIEARLRELDGIDRQFQASRRRFRMAAFLKWQAAAKARQRRVAHAHANGGR